MIQMMMATIGGSAAARDAQWQQAFRMRKAIGFMIVASGWAVLVAQALQHTLGG